MKAIMRDEREMKDSGIEWIGQLPLNWKVMTIKYTSWLKGRIGWQGLKSTEFVDNGPYLITGTDFKNGIVNWDTCAHITDDRFIEDEDIHIIEDDLLITKDGTIGKVAIAKNCPEKVSLNSGVLLIRNDKIKYIDKYLYYTLLSEEFILWYELNQPQNSTIRHLYQGQFYNFKFAFPPYDEQQAIVHYLDDRCSKIDTIIAEAKASIEEYKELKQAVIYEAVTKGLEKNTELKIVNNHGINKVPKSWNKIKLGWFCSFHNGDRSNKYPSGNDFQDYGVPFIGADSLNEIYVNIDKCRYITSKKYEDMGGLKIRKDDILYTLRGSTIGKCAITNFDHGTVASSLTGIRVEKTDKLYPMFLLYWLQSQCEYNQRTILINGATAPNLSAENVGQYNLFIPSLDEQMSIAQFLSNVLGKYNSLLYEKQSLIEDLESYKKSLIYEVVTGKRKVVA